MRKLLTATTALALVGGAAFAEIEISGSAEAVFDFTSNPEEGKSKHEFNHQMDIDFAGSGTTDGGLTFGGSAGFNTGGDSTDEGTVYVSGAFGKLTFGDNDSADLLSGGIADVGLNGIGVDNVVEDNRGTTENQFRYDNSFGAISIAVSAGIKNGSEAVEAKNGFFGYLLPGQTAIPEDAMVNPYYSALTPRVTFEGDSFNGSFDTAFASAFKPSVASYALKATDDMAGWKLNSEGKPAKAITEDNPKGTPLAGAELESFQHYVAHHDLGADMAIGGTDSDTAKNGDIRLPGSVTVIAPVEAMDAVPSDNHYAFGMSFEASGVTVGIGHDSEGATSVGVGFSTGEISTNALYVKGDTADSVGADVSYTMGASTLTLAYARMSLDVGDAKDATGIGVTHDLGGGASLNAGFGQVEEVNRASVGLSFSF